MMVWVNLPNYVIRWRTITRGEKMKYQDLLNEYLSGIDLLNVKIQNLTDNDLNYRPERLDAWSIKEHIIHLVDSEVNGFIR